MPKKTKREKLLAQRHRQSLPPPVISQVPTRAPAPGPQPYQFTASSITTRPPTPKALVSTQEFTAIKKDLVKTVIITGAIIISEFMLAHYLPH